ncbi:isochorismate synthase [Notoacmeibacter ruber]|uniref:isochorismate synthase n=2 Tax=Notoacmeibacter ruber TaxID=2670375 RepID=A0A3L7JFI5_9HYPH|nr:isochorismate synthase [Notoacmeibacter ruber]
MTVETNTARTLDEKDALFAFQSRHHAFRGLGRAAMLPRGNASTISERSGAFFAKAGAEAILAGALPFDRGGDDYLWQAEQVVPARSWALPRPAPPLRWNLRAEPDAAEYAKAVGNALRIMAADTDGSDRLTKIVLARSLLATADHDIDVEALFGKLATDPAVTAFLVPLPEKDGRPRLMAGATPELLLEKTGTQIVSHPLAGSAKRHDELARDAEAAAALNRSVKDRSEHAIVVEFILDMLAPYCSDLRRPDGMTVTSTRSMWHLGTRIEGELKNPDVPAVVLASALHPTPAVCGLPRDRCTRLIRDLEPAERDFYAGSVGWCDGKGDGAWYVTIRCAEICGAQARLFAGAGIVPQSDPVAEAAETGAKFNAMLNALGIDPSLEAFS